MMLKEIDKEIYDLIGKEYQRQEENIELIASENFVSRAVLEAQGSILTNKYAEGYSKKRYYGGCEYIDEVEDLANSRIRKLFNAKYSNVQPHSGSQANMAAYRAVLAPGDIVLGMRLSDGGHLTHGHQKSFSGADYRFYSYGVDINTGLIDYDEVRRIASEVHPKLIVCGASAYPRIIDLKKFKEIADEVGAYLMCDMAHIAGLVASDLHPNPCDYADIVTTTTHKTLRGPRGGAILTNNPTIAKKVDSAVFPGIQGGPLMHVIAAKAVCFKEALEDEFKTYSKQVILNAKALAKRLMELGYKVVSNGTDNHLLLVDVKSSLDISGLEAQNRLALVNITVNKNTIPGDTLKPTITSGIRLGSPAMTTRGFKEEEFIMVANIIDEALRSTTDENIKQIKAKVEALVAKFPYDIN